MVLNGKAWNFVEKLHDAQNRLRKSPKRLETIFPQLRHVLYNNVRDDSGYLVRHLANDFVWENLGLEW